MILYDELTKVDIEKLQAELDHRVRELRPQLIEEVKVARGFGDLSENFEYKAAKREKNRNESRIRYLERMIKTAKVIPAGDARETDAIGLFDKVVIYIEEDDEEQEIRLVTTLRQNALKWLISKESPVGKAVMGHRAGDRCVPLCIGLPAGSPPQQQLPGLEHGAHGLSRAEGLAGGGQGHRPGREAPVLSIAPDQVGVQPLAVRAPLAGPQFHSRQQHRPLSEGRAGAQHALFIGLSAVAQGCPRGQHAAPRLRTAHQSRAAPEHRSLQAGALADGTARPHNAVGANVGSGQYPGVRADQAGPFQHGGAIHRCPGHLDDPALPGE